VNGGTQRGWLSRIGWLCLALTCGCGLLDSWPDTPPYCSTHAAARREAGEPGPGPAELCRIIGERLCDQWARCGCQDGTGEIVSEGCVANVESECDDYLASPAVLADLDAGRMVWSGGAANRFVAALTSATASCEPAHLDVSKVTIGRRRDGARCDPVSPVLSECLDRSMCQSLFRGPPGYYCHASSWSVPSLVPLGERCRGNYDCQADARCAHVCSAGPDEGVCAERLAVGQACSTLGDCRSGLCEPEVGSGRYDSDPRGRCVEAGTRGLGESCRMDTVCASGLCERHHGSYDSITGEVITGACAPLLSIGSDCDRSAHCESHACAGFRFVELNECEGTGEPCRDTHDCACVGGLMLGTCVVPVRNGTACRDSAACASDYCDPPSGVCADPAPAPADLHQPCDESLGCTEGRCISGRCTLGNAPGESCSWRFSCASGSCVAGQCQPTACVAYLAQTAGWFGWTLRPH